MGEFYSLRGCRSIRPKVLGFGAFFQEAPRALKAGK